MLQNVLCPVDRPRHPHTADGKCPLKCPKCGCKRRGATGDGKECACAPNLVENANSVHLSLDMFRYAPDAEELLKSFVTVR